MDNKLMVIGDEALAAVAGGGKRKYKGGKAHAEGAGSVAAAGGTNVIEITVKGNGSVTIDDSTFNQDASANVSVGSTPPYPCY